MSKNDPHILGKGGVGELLLQYSIPAIIGVTITSIYNIIDNIFIGYGVGPMATVELATSFPLMNPVVAFYTLILADSSTLASIRLGQKDMKGATEILPRTLMPCITNSFFFGILSFIFLDGILVFFGVSSETFSYARSSIQVILLGAPITRTTTGLNNVMRATGYPKKTMLTSMVTMVANITLAPIFIFRFERGMRGTATAAVISQLIGMVWVVSHFVEKGSTVHFEGNIWGMKRRIIESIFTISMSPFLMNVYTCAIVIIISNSLQNHRGDMAIGAHDIINRLLTLYVMIVLGLAMGVQPIVGCNFGTRKIDHVKQTLRLGIISRVVITSGGFIICELFPHAVSALLTDSDELIDLAVDGIRPAVLIFPFVGAQIMIGNFFQNIGKAKVSIFLSLARQLLYLLPCLLLFPNRWELEGIWVSMPVSSALAFTTAVVSLMIYIREVSKQHPETVTE